MRISEVAKRAELTKKAVLYYCEQGLLFPKILENGYRSFSEADVIRCLLYTSDAADEL